MEKNNLKTSSDKGANLLDKRMEIIFKKFQFDLNLNKETINYAKQLFENLKKKDPFNKESPYLLIAVCIFTVSRVDEQPRRPSEVSKVFRLKETHLVKVYKMVIKEFEASLKGQ